MGFRHFLGKHWRLENWVNGYFFQSGLNYSVHSIRVSNLVWVFVGAHSFCWFCHVAAHHTFALQINQELSKIVLWPNARYVESNLLLKITLCLHGLLLLLYYSTTCISCLRGQVKTVTPDVLWTTWCTVAEAIRPRATVHQVIHSTEGAIVLTVAHEGMK